MKPRTTVVGKAPFLHMSRASMEHFSVHAQQILLTLPLSSISDPDSINTAVLKQVLHKPFTHGHTAHDPVTLTSTTTTTTTTTTSSSSTVDAAAAALSSSSHRAMLRVVVDVLSVSPLTDTVRQLVGKPFFTVCVLAQVRVASVHNLGEMLGIALESPYSNTFRVRLLISPETIAADAATAAAQAAATEDGASSSSHAAGGEADPVVLCRCFSDEPVVKGYTVIVAVEPNLIQCVAIRPPRTTTGRWRREVTDVRKLEMKLDAPPPSFAQKYNPLHEQEQQQPEKENAATGSAVDVSAVETRKDVPRKRLRAAEPVATVHTGTKQTFADSDDE